MQSRISFFNKTIFFKNMTRFWPLWATYLLVWIFVMPVSLWGLINSPYYITQGSDQIKDIITSQIYLTGVLGGSSIALGFGILGAMAVFSYLYQSKSACLYHALPIKREGLFITNYLSGLSFFIVPNVVVFLITAIVLSSCGCADIIALLTWLFVVSAMSLFFYSFGVFCAMFTGNLLALPVFYGVLNFVAIGLEIIVKMVLSSFVFGMTYDRASALGILSPWYKINTMAIYSNDRFSGWNVIVGYALAGLAFAAIGLLIYRKRHVETAGDVVALRPIKPVFKYGVAFCAAMILGYVIYRLLGQNDNGNSFVRMLACMLASGFVGYFAAEMLLKKSFKVLRRGLRGYLVFSTVVVVLIVAMKLDVFGFEGRVPSATNVSKVFVGRYISFPGNGTFSENNNNNGNGLLTEDTKIIEEIIELHESVVINKEAIQGNDYGNSYGQVGETTQSTSLAIYYIMKDGRTLYRSYDIPVTQALLNDSSSFASKYAMLLNAPESILNSKFQDSLEKINFSNGHISPGYHMGFQVNGVYDENVRINQADIYLNQDESYLLYKAIIKDISEGTIGKTYLFMDDEYYDTVYSYYISLFYNGVSPELSNSGALSSMTNVAGFQLEKSSKNTIAALEKMGFLDAEQLVTMGEATGYQKVNEPTQ